MLLLWPISTARQNSFIFKCLLCSELCFLFSCHVPTQTSLVDRMLNVTRGWWGWKSTGIPDQIQTGDTKIVYANMNRTKHKCKCKQRDTCRILNRIICQNKTHSLSVSTTSGVHTFINNKYYDIRTLNKALSRNILQRLSLFINVWLTAWQTQNKQKK